MWMLNLLVPETSTLLISVWVTITCEITGIHGLSNQQKNYSESQLIGQIMWKKINVKVGFARTTFLLSLLELSKRSLLLMNEEKTRMRDVLGTVLEWAKGLLHI